MRDNLQKDTGSLDTREETMNMSLRDTNRELLTLSSQRFAGTTHMEDMENITSTTIIRELEKKDPIITKNIINQRITIIMDIGLLYLHLHLLHILSGWGRRLCIIVGLEKQREGTLTRQSTFTRQTTLTRQNILTRGGISSTNSIIRDNHLNWLTNILKGNH